MIEAILSRRPVVVLSLTLGLMFGLFAYFVTMPRESFPEIEIAQVLVTTPYIGVSPKDIEGLVTTPIENEISSLQDLKRMNSTSAEGASIIHLEFESDVDIDNVLQLVRDRVARARTKLPSDVEESDIREISPNPPVLNVAISGGASEQALKRIAEDLADEIKRMDGVLEAGVSGGRESIIRVYIYPNELRHYGLSMDDVIGALQNENVNIPGGDVTSGEASILLRVPGDFKLEGSLQALAKTIEAIAVKRVGDRPVLLGQLARVEASFEDRTSYARMNGQSAVSIAVTKRSGANILNVVNGVKELVTESSETWPPETTYRFLNDQSMMIGDMISELENGIITALILVVAVLLFAMGARNSLFVALAIPVSMLLGVMVLSVLGFTLNMMVLFSLIFVLGMLVDNAIVLVENIYRHVEAGMNIWEASILGTKEVGLAVAGSTATTVAAFVPMFFWPGIMGKFMGFMPRTVVVVLLASLFVALVVLPVATSAFMRLSGRGNKEGLKKTQPAQSQSVQGFMARYQRILEWAIDHRYLALGIVVGGFFFSFFLMIMAFPGGEFMPAVEPNKAFVRIRTPDGTDINTTDHIVRQVEQVLLSEENVDVYIAETGVVASGDPFAGSQAQPNQATLTVDFLPDRNTVKPGQKVRIESTFETVEKIRAGVAHIVGAEVSVVSEEQGPPQGSEVEIQVRGNDFHQVGLAAAELRRELLAEIKEGDVPAIADLTSDYRVGRPELRLRIDRARAKRVGASTREVGSTVRTAIAGTTATTIRNGEDEYDVVVELAPEYRENLQQVLAMNIPGRLDTNPDTFMVPISAVADYELAGGSGSIRHIDQDLVVTLSGNASREVTMSPQAVQQAAGEYVRTKAKLPPGMSAGLGVSDEMQRESMAFMGQALVVAIFLIMIVLVLQFNGFYNPMIIISTVVLSLMGVFLGIVITRTKFGLMPAMGVVSLAGIVVNNAIVLLDYVEQLRSEGVSIREALIQAGLTRFRPVILTAITTVLGLVPMAAGISFDFIKFKWLVNSTNSQWWGPMAIAVISGLGVATLLTLIVVPTLYSILHKGSDAESNHAAPALTSA